jgi:MoaA/NifB/PqqE/SkfB family radical SAM enzyme
MSFRKSISSITNTSGLILRTAAGAVNPSVPPYLIFFVTDRCNARCPFCFNRGKQEGAEERSELSLDEIQRIANNFRGVLQVTLTGGEPFLRDDIGKIAMAFVRAGAKSLTIDTNGVLTGRITDTAASILEAAPGLFLDLDLSVDGPPEVHDMLRGIEGAHGKVMDTARELSRLHDRFPGFRTGATVTVSGFNRDTAPETVEELAGSGLFRRVQAVWVRGRPFDPAALDADFSAYERCAQFLGQRRPSKGAGRIRETLSAMVRDTVAATVREGRLVRPCLAGRTMVTVDPLGNVYPCEMLAQLFPEGDQAADIESWEMGSLKDNGYDVRRIVAAEKARRITHWIRDTGCFCSFECAAYNNIVFSSRYWPSVLLRLSGL